jgi:hypothetical protein
LCSDIRNTCHADVRRVFSKAAEQLTEDLAYIRKHEVRINVNSARDILHLNQITQDKKQLAVELRSLIEIVKRFDYECKDLAMKTQQYNVSIYYLQDIYIYLLMCVLVVRTPMRRLWLILVGRNN